MGMLGAPIGMLCSSLERGCRGTWDLPLSSHSEVGQCWEVPQILHQGFWSRLLHPGCHLGKEVVLLGGWRRSALHLCGGEGQGNLLCVGEGSAPQGWEFPVLTPISPLTVKWVGVGKFRESIIKIF